MEGKLNRIHLEEQKASQRRHGRKGKNILDGWDNTYKDIKLLENPLLREQKGVGGLESMEYQSQIKEWVSHGPRET